MAKKEKIPLCCYSCMHKTDNFYVNKTTGKRAKHCRVCSTVYTAEERKQREFENITEALSKIDIE